MHRIPIVAVLALAVLAGCSNPEAEATERYCGVVASTADAYGDGKAPPKPDTDDGRDASSNTIATLSDTVAPEIVAWHEANDAFVSASFERRDQAPEAIRSYWDAIIAADLAPYDQRVALAPAERTIADDRIEAFEAEHC